MTDPNRRETLRRLTRLALMTLPIQADLFSLAHAGDARAIFGARDMAGALALLGGDTALESSAITISAPDVAEDGAVVPIGVVSTLPDTESITLLVDKNPVPVAAQFFPQRGTPAEIQTRIRMSETARVRAIVRAGGQLHHANRQVVVTIGGCGGDLTTAYQRERKTPAPIRLRAVRKDGHTEVRAVMFHPMETGQRKDGAGQRIPPHHIVRIQVERNGVAVLTAETGGSLSENPFFGFRLSGGAAGDRIRLNWTDNLGDSRSDEVVLE